MAIDNINYYNLHPESKNMFDHGSMKRRRKRFVDPEKQYKRQHRGEQEYAMQLSLTTPAIRVGARRDTDTIREEEAVDGTTMVVPPNAGLDAQQALAMLTLLLSLSLSLSQHIRI